MKTMLLLLLLLPLCSAAPLGGDKPGIYDAVEELRKRIDTIEEYLKENSNSRDGRDLNGDELDILNNIAPAIEILKSCGKDHDDGACNAAQIQNVSEDIGITFKRIREGKSVGSMLQLHFNRLKMEIDAAIEMAEEEITDELAGMGGMEVAKFVDGTCYADDHYRFLLPDRILYSATNSPDECIETCASRGYSYAGVQYSHECFCGNHEPPASRIRDSSQCRMKCPGDSRLNCGGDWRMNIYAVIKSGNGKEVCEGHGYDEATCAAIGCCQFDDGLCWSSVGKRPCGKSDEAADCPMCPDCSEMFMPKGPQGPPGAVLEYDLLSNSQSGIDYPEYPEKHLGAFIPVTKYNQQNGAKQIFVPSATHQNLATNEIVIIAEKFEDEHFTKITSARLVTKGVWTTAHSRKTKVRGYLEVRALMPAKINGDNFKGAWPAIRMLGADEQEWPKNSEISIAELKNGDPTVHMTLRSTKYRGSNGQHPPNNPVHLAADMTKIPVIFGLEWNVDNGIPDEQNGMINLTWWITSFDDSSKQWKSGHTTKSLLESNGDDSYFSVFKNAFNGDGFYLLVELAEGGDFTGIDQTKDLLVDDTHHIIIESAKVYRLEDPVTLLDDPPMPTTMNNIDYLFRGYDLMKGNPLPTEYNIDPGFKTKIFKVSYESKKLTGDLRYKMPDGTDIISCTGSCTLSFDSKSFSGAKSYQESLGQKVSTSVGAEIEGFGGSFTASAGFKHVSEKTASHSSLFTVSSATCCSYKAFFTFPKQQLSEGFLFHVRDLTDTYDEKYQELINTYGTHYITEVVLGALYGQQSEISTEEWTKMRSDGVEIEIGASASAYGITASSNYQVDTEKKKAKEFSERTSHQDTITIGQAPPSDNNLESWSQAIINDPAPMAMKVRPISEILDMDIFEIKDISPLVKANLKRALREYCDHLKKFNEVSSCSELGTDPSFPEPNRDRLYMGETLSNGEFLKSDDGTHVFAVRGDGNMVIYRNHAGGRTKKKASDTYTPGSQLKLDGHGNLILTKPDGGVAFQAKTDNDEANYLKLQNDGSLAVFTKNNVKILTVDLHKVCATLFEHADYSGQSINLHFSKPISSLVPIGWNDKISSIRIFGGSIVYAFEHHNYGGEVLLITSDKLIIRPNDWISSIRCRVQVCPETDIDYYGNDIRNIRLPFNNWENCAEKCSEEDGCSHWTLANRICYLKSSNSGGKRAPGLISGSSNCQASDRMQKGQNLIGDKEDSLRSQNGKYDLVMQSDGNLVIYRNDNGGRTVEYATGTSSGAGTYLVFQDDGNLVMYNDGTVVWATNTQSADSLVMQDNGNLVLYDGHNVRWAANSVKLWRDDGRCGESHPLPNGEPGQCDPTGNANEKGPCCSNLGWCGNSDAHCKCSSCVNYAVTCPTGWIKKPTGCYKFVESTDAKTGADNCKSHDGYLAVINSQEEQDVVWQINESSGESLTFWIGGSDQAEEGTWVDHDGAELTYTNWKEPHEPNGGTQENCIAFVIDWGGKWNDAPCTNFEKKSLCEYTGP